MSKETQLLDALYWMYVQYCGNGHYFMGAGETASELLEDAGYITVAGDGTIDKDNGDSETQKLAELVSGAPKSAKPNTESDKSIDTILNKYVSNYNLEVLGFRQSGQETVKSEIYSLLMDVIGTDEDETNTKDGITNVRVFSENRNQLRAEQRTKLTELFNVEEK